MDWYTIIKMLMALIKEFSYGLSEAEAEIVDLCEDIHNKHGKTVKPYGWTDERFTEYLATIKDLTEKMEEAEDMKRTLNRLYRKACEALEAETVA